MPRYRITVAYDGTSFHGWQKQHPPGSAPLRTVQGVLEEAIRSIAGVDKVNVLGASRTDSGVHARGQVAAFTIEREFDARKLPMILTSRLPEDVQVLDAAIVDPSFSPISDCTAKGYRYTIAWGRKRGIQRPLFERHFVMWTGYELDVKRMQAAAPLLIGTHDFASFTRKSHGRETTVRTIFSCEASESGEREIQIDISGDGFLYNMVRIVAGTLLEIGRGQWEPQRMKEILEARDREAAGPTLPPEGLCLEWVSYDAPPPAHA